MATPGRRHFTVREAEEFIPTLERVMQRIRACHGESSRLQGELHDAQRQVMLVGGTRLNQEFWRVRRARLGELTAALRQGIGEILEIGATVKDIELGLVDFPFMLGGREVNLCWRLGEREIRFWHGVDEGYGARKPLPDEAGGSS